MGFFLAHKDTILDYLNTHKGFFCDDCLSENCDIVPRQTVFQVCTKLNKQGLIKRGITACNCCGRIKKSNSAREGAIVQLPKVPKHNRIQHHQEPQHHKENYNQTNGFESFIEVGLEFGEFDIENTFTKFNAYTLGEILNKDKYSKFVGLCQKKYFAYMEMKLGEFLGILKEQGDSFYKKFLNAYGDSTYCKFGMVDQQFSKRKGIYVFKSNGQIKYIGRVKGEYNFYQRINMGYAIISPKNCYIDGQSTNCHVNSIINSYKGNITLFILPLENDEEIIKTEKWLINLVKPDWNISLK